MSSGINVKNTNVNSLSVIIGISNKIGTITVPIGSESKRVTLPMRLPLICWLILLMSLIYHYHVCSY
jgi:hypothetical protein